MKSRRIMMSAVAIGAAAALISGCTGNAAPGGGEVTLTIADGGGSYHDVLVKEVYEPFEKATGIKVRSVSYDYSASAIRAQVEGAKQWDVVLESNPLASKDVTDLFLPIDYGIVNNPGLPSQAKLPNEVISVYYGACLAYRTDKFDEPAGWEAIWDVKNYPGPRALMNDPSQTLEIALLADGVAADKLYPLDVDRAFKKLDNLLSIAKVNWFQSGAEQVQYLTTGIADIGLGWNGRISAAKAEGAPVDYTLNGCLSASGPWAALKSTKNPDAAMKFLKFVTSPRIGAADAIGFPGNSPANADSFEFVPAEIGSKLPTNPANADVVGPTIDWLWWEANYAEVSKKWVEWFSAQS